MGRDEGHPVRQGHGHQFQSTLPAWGETSSCPRRLTATVFQSTLPAWGETQSDIDTYVATLISIHSPRMGRDLIDVQLPSVHSAISIHSPRMGRDRLRREALPPGLGISIHSPRMGRDSFRHLRRDGTFISIHSPRMGRDHWISIRSTFWAPFQSTLPAWGETSVFIFAPQKYLFQSTLPAWGETANAHNFSKRKTGASAQHCIFSPAKRFFLLTKNFLEKRNKPFFRCEPYRKTVGAPVSHQPLKN